MFMKIFGRDKRRINHWIKYTRECTGLSTHYLGLLSFTPETKSGLSPFFSSPVLIVNLVDVIYLFGNGGIEPQSAIFSGGYAARSVRARRGVVVPGGGGNERAAFDPIHEVRGSSNKVNFVHTPLHMYQIRAEVENHAGFQLSGVAHSPNRGFTGFGDGFDPDPVRGMQPGGCGEDAAVAFPGVFDNCNQKRAIAPVSADEIEFIETLRDPYINRSQPEILKRAPASVECPGERRTVGADAIREGGKGDHFVGNSLHRSLCDSINDQGVSVHGEVEAVLFGVADGDEEDGGLLIADLWLLNCSLMSCRFVRWEGDERIMKRDVIGLEDSLRGEGVDAVEAVVAEAMEEVREVGREDGFREGGAEDSEITPAPAVGNRGQ